jgi:NAD(P)-dependent dehydrogenase (short-subunit alcohol dehydrogenase family)
MYIVTGSQSGIGRSVYESLKQTDSVIGIDIKNSDIICDLSYKEDVERLSSQIYSYNKDISGVVTCAGVNGGHSLIPLNYFGSIRLIENIYNHYGSVNAILIGSIMITQSKADNNLISLLLDNKEQEAIDYCKKSNLTDTEVYSNVKLALKIWCRKFIKDRPKARVNIVHPSLVKTGMTEAYLESEIIKIIFSKSIDRGYIGGPEEVSGLICYLIKNSKSVNGQSIFVDNGTYEQ